MLVQKASRPSRATARLETLKILRVCNTTRSFPPVKVQKNQQHPETCCDVSKVPHSSSGVSSYKTVYSNENPTSG